MKLLTLLKSLCLCAAIFTLISAGLLFLSARTTLQSANQLVTDSRQAVLDTLNRIDAAVIIANATLVNSSELLGRINDAAEKQSEYWQEMTVTTSQALSRISSSADSLDRFIRNTDRAVNGELLPSSAQTVKKVELLMTETTKQLTAISLKSQDLITDFQGELLPITQNIEQITANTNETMQNVRDMSAEIRLTAPKIMGDIESISNRSNKWHPWIMAASLAGTVIGIFGFIF